MMNCTMNEIIYLIDMSNFFGQNSFLFDRNISIYSLQKKIFCIPSSSRFYDDFQDRVYLFILPSTHMEFYLGYAEKFRHESDESNLANKLSTNIVVAAYPKSSAVRIKSNL